MNNILFDKEDSLVMNIVSKCIDKFPKWEEFSKNIPFIITVSVGVAFLLMSRAEEKK